MTEKKSSAYVITHCIFCGKSKFANFDEVLKHVHTDCPFKQKERKA